MAQQAYAYVTLVPVAEGFQSAVAKQLSGMNDIGKDVGDKVSKGVGSGLSKLGGLVAGAFAVGAVANFTKELVTAAEAEQVSNARLESIAKSMNLFGSETGTVTKRLQDLATTQQLSLGIDDDIIKSTQAKLLTFKDLAITADEAGGAFDRATTASLDLAAAGFGTAETNAVQLGKALQDPIKGITALARSGVTFTEVEKARIKTLVESNQLGEAQALILGAIEMQVGGTAAATTTASGRMTEAFAALKETIGLILLPAFTAMGTYLADTILPTLTQFFADVQAGTTPLNDLWDTLVGMLNFVKDNWHWISTLSVAVLAGVAAFKIYNGVVETAKAVQIAWTAAQAAGGIIMGILKGQTIAATLAQLGMNAAFIANPIGAVIALVVALVAGLVFFFTQTKAGQAAWKAFTDFLGTSIKVAGDIIASVWEAIKVSFEAVFNFLSQAFANWVNGVIGGINSVISLANTALSAISAVTGGAVNIKVPTVPKLKVPKLAEGGYVDSPTMALIGEAGPEVVVPLDRFEKMMSMDNGGGGKQLNYYAAPDQSIDSEQALFTAIRRAKVVTGW